MSCVPNSHVVLLQKQAALARFLRTAAQPRLLWQPARHCADTILLQEQAQLDLAVWLVRVPLLVAGKC